MFLCTRTIIVFVKKGGKPAISKVKEWADKLVQRSQILDVAIPSICSLIHFDTTRSPLLCYVINKTHTTSIFFQQLCSRNEHPQQFYKQNVVWIKLPIKLRNETIRFIRNVKTFICNLFCIVNELKFLLCVFIQLSLTFKCNITTH